jgi:hypothetical protein
MHLHRKSIILGDIDFIDQIFFHMGSKEKPLDGEASNFNSLTNLYADFAVKFPEGMSQQLFRRSSESALSGCSNKRINLAE